jgi:hypothetical protein
MSEEASEGRYDTAHFMDNLCRVMRNYDLSWGEMGVLGCLIRHDCPDPRNGGNRKEEVWPSPSNGLRKMTGKDRQVLQVILKSLEKKGLITCLTPERSKGGRGQVHHWRPNYAVMGWKFPPGETATNHPGLGEKLQQITPVSPEKLQQITPGIWESDSESRNPPPPEPPPSSQPAGSPLDSSPLEEEEFPFLSPDERTCLLALQISPALWQRVRQSDPTTLQWALQHVITHREEILASPPHSLECRLGGLLKGTYIPSSEPEVLVREEEAPAWYYLCRACGVMHQGEHQCSSPRGREPLGERDRWLQEMKERAERAQCSYAS